jgi:hypothetical protein
MLPIQALHDLQTQKGVASRAEPSLINVTKYKDYKIFQPRKESPPGWKQILSQINSNKYNGYKMHTHLKHPNAHSLETTRMSKNLPQNQ